MTIPPPPSTPPNWPEAYDQLERAVRQLIDDLRGNPGPAILEDDLHAVEQLLKHSPLTR